MEAGDAHGYHAMTYGWLVGEVVRRVAGQTIGRYFRREVAEPLGADFWIGLGAEHDARTADLLMAPPPAADQVDMFREFIANPDSMAAKAFLNPSTLTASPNSREWRSAEIPAANGHGNARALARIYGALANGGSLDGHALLRPDTIARAHEAQAGGPDAVLPLRTRMGLGFTTDEEKLGPNPRAFGHGGAGGSLGYADPDAGLGFGYVMNQMKTGQWLIDPRPTALIEAVYASL